MNSKGGSGREVRWRRWWRHVAPVVAAVAAAHGGGGGGSGQVGKVGVEWHLKITGTGERSRAAGGVAMAMSELLAARLALGLRARLSSLPLLHRVDRPHGLCGMSSSGVQFVSSSTSAASISRPVCRLSSQSSRVL